MKIVIWTGPAWETWGGDSLLTGIGGSEAAAVYLSRELALLGHEVEVVGQVRPSEERRGPGTVRFVDHREFAEYGGWGPQAGQVLREGRRVECDVFVSSRYLTASDAVRPDCRLRCLWMHDVHAGPDHRRRLGGYDVVFCLSRWALDLAQRFYPHVPPGKFVQTRNGIPVDLYRAEPVKTGWRVVYSSSPDRGLDRLLDFWPTVRRLRPDAELHVYYGFDTWEMMATRACDDVAAAQIQIYKTRLAAMAGQGVVAHGRVGQPELAAAWLGASAWLYPTNFSETSCITAMEAQAAGAYCVCTRQAALPETARYAQLVDPPSTREGYREEFLKCVDAIERSCWQTDVHPNPVELRDRVEEGRDWALRELGWAGVARQWDEIFRSRSSP
jgi:glycosyltransferase involved in cell wall biosynthesis